MVFEKDAVLKGVETVPLCCVTFDLTGGKERWDGWSYVLESNEEERGLPSEGGSRHLHPGQVYVALPNEGSI